MRDKNQVGQIICSCGRVAELRTRANGKRLPFLMCKHCGMQQGKESLRAEWLANEKENHSLGVYGEFPAGSAKVEETSNTTSKTIEPEQLTTSSKVEVKHQAEWQPEADNPTEAMIKEQAAKQAKPEDTSKSTSSESSSGGLGLGAKIGLGLLAVAGAVFGFSKLNISK